MPDNAAAIPLPFGKAGRASAVLARAFHDDPGVVWVLPDSRKRPRLLRYDFANLLRYGRRHGEVFTLPSGDVPGAAIWLPPDEPHLTFGRSLRAGFFSAPLKLAPLPLLRFLSSMAHLDRLHRRDAPARHWYLAVLGVEPELQGKGVGSALIAPALERADRQRTPCYLETGKEINVRFYGKHGFDVVREGALPLGGPRYWTMLREPIG